MDSFRTNLEEFAGQHREEIRKNPQFRSQFQEMCAAIGVDPLACKFHISKHVNNVYFFIVNVN